MIIIINLYININIFKIIVDNFGKDPSKAKVVNSLAISTLIHFQIILNLKAAGLCNLNEETYLNY